MSVEGLWQLSFGHGAAGIVAQSGLIKLDGCAIRAADASHSTAGHYRINGDVLTCFLRFMNGASPEPPILQIVGQLDERSMQMRGTVIDASNQQFEARLARPPAAPAT